MEQGSSQQSGERTDESQEQQEARWRCPDCQDHDDYVPSAAGSNEATPTPDGERRTIVGNYWSLFKQRLGSKVVDKMSRETDAPLLSINREVLFTDDRSAPAISAGAFYFNISESLITDLNEVIGAPVTRKKLDTYYRLYCELTATLAQLDSALEHPTRVPPARLTDAEIIEVQNRRVALKGRCSEVREIYENLKSEHASRPRGLGGVYRVIALAGR